MQHSIPPNSDPDRLDPDPQKCFLSPSILIAFMSEVFPKIRTPLICLVGGKQETISFEEKKISITAGKLIVMTNV